MERFRPPQNPDMLKMFGGIQPSKQAEDLARKAISLGQDPTALTQRAGKVAILDGRTKVGFFGQAETYLNSLKGVISSIEGKEAMNESRKRASKGNF